MTRSLWVFGYGSLLWSPGFQFTAAQPGVLKGFSRRFYQGNETHRGRPGKPGRVATLVEDKEGETWGVAFEVLSPEALPYLDQRECQLGGYTTLFLEFQPTEGEPFPVLVYWAGRDSCHWLGHAPEQEIADQILSSSGPSGHNVEYLLRLAEYVRMHSPETRDDHLFLLEALVRRGIQDRGLAMKELMGPDITLPQPTPISPDDQPPTHQQFAPNVPSKKLRCLSI